LKFQNRYGENESDSMVLFRFHLGLKEDLRQEIFVRDICNAQSRGYGELLLLTYAGRNTLTYVC